MRQDLSNLEPSIHGCCQLPHHAPLSQKGGGESIQTGASYTSDAVPVMAAASWCHVEDIAAIIEWEGSYLWCTRRASVMSNLLSRALPCTPPPCTHIVLPVSQHRLACLMIPTSQQRLAWLSRIFGNAKSTCQSARFGKACAKQFANTVDITD